MLTVVFTPPKSRSRYRTATPPFFMVSCLAVEAPTMAPARPKAAPPTTALVIPPLVLVMVFSPTFFNFVFFKFRKLEHNGILVKLLCIGDTSHFIFCINEDGAATKIIYSHVGAKGLKSGLVFIPSRFYLVNRCHGGSGANGIAEHTNTTVTDLDRLHMKFQTATVTYILFTKQADHPFT